MYELVLADHMHEPHGAILGASDIQYLRGLNKLASLSFSAPMTSEHIDELASCAAHIKVYRDSQLLFHGPIVTAEETVQREERSIAVTCLDAGWFLGKTLAGKSRTGTLWTTATARHTIAKALVDAANAEQETGIDTTFYTWSSGSAITYKAGPYLPVLQCVQELGSALDGFDWFIHPRENWIDGAMANDKIGTMEVSTLLGSTQPNVVFEYGANTRSNVLSYTKTTTRDQQANKVYHVGADASDPKTGLNGPAEAEWGTMEDVIQGDFTDATMRQKLVDAHAAVRGNPRTIIKMTPHIDPGEFGRVPEPFVEYDVGDTVTFRAVANDSVRFSGSVRVYGIQTSIDPAGFERVELFLQDE